MQKQKEKKNKTKSNNFKTFRGNSFVAHREKETKNANIYKTDKKFFYNGNRIDKYV